MNHIHILHRNFQELYEGQAKFEFKVLPYFDLMHKTAVKIFFKSARLSKNTFQIFINLYTSPLSQFLKLWISKT